MCDNCLDEDSLPTKSEAKLTSPLDSFSEKVKTSLSEIVPKALKDSLPLFLQDNVKKAVSDSLPSFRDVATSKPATSGNNCELQFVITGAPETEPSYLKQLEKDSDQVNEIVNHLGLSPDNNITSIRRLGKKENPTNNLKRNCRPLLVTTSNSLFMQKCFARSHHLQTHSMPVYIKKFLSSKERETEEAIFAKRYSMITNEGKGAKRFQDQKLDTILQRSTCPG